MKMLKSTDPKSVEELLRQVQDEEILVLRDGKPVALVQPFDEDDLQWYVRERDPAFIHSIAKARQDIRDGSGLSHEALKADLGESTSED